MATPTPAALQTTAAGPGLQRQEAGEEEAEDVQAFAVQRQEEELEEEGSEG